MIATLATESNGMLNNLIFLISIFLITSFAWGALRLGKTALITWIALVSLLANLFVLKQITLFGLNATASDMFAVGGLFGLNLLQEYHGKQAGKKAAIITFACLLFFTFTSQIHLMYEPSIFDHTQSAYQTVFQHAPRVVLASLLTLFVVQQFDIRFYPFLRRCWPRLPIIFINVIAIAISQTLDTALFTVLGLYGIASALLEIFIVSLTIKWITIVCLPFMAPISKKLIHDARISAP